MSPLFFSQLNGSSVFNDWSYLNDFVVLLYEAPNLCPNLCELPALRRLAFSQDGMRNFCVFAVPPKVAQCHIQAEHRSAPLGRTPTDWDPCVCPPRMYTELALYYVTDASSFLLNTCAFNFVCSERRSCFLQLLSFFSTFFNCVFLNSQISCPTAS